MKKAPQKGFKCSDEFLRIFYFFFKISLSCILFLEYQNVTKLYFYSAHKGLNLLLKIYSTDNELMVKLHNNAKKKKLHLS